jgi:hypothetical protein
MFESLISQEQMVRMFEYCRGNGVVISPNQGGWRLNDLQVTLTQEVNGSTTRWLAVGPASSREEFENILADAIDAVEDYEP